MEQTIKFTKKNTLAVKGIAISFLLCYHCFSADCQNGWGRSEFLAASTESSNADQLMHGALRRDVCIFVRIWADTLYEVKISGI